MERSRKTLIGVLQEELHGIGNIEQLTTIKKNLGLVSSDEDSRIKGAICLARDRILADFSDIILNGSGYDIFASNHRLLNRAQVILRYKQNGDSLPEAVAREFIELSGINSKRNQAN